MWIFLHAVSNDSILCSNLDGNYFLRFPDSPQLLNYQYRWHPSHAFPRKHIRCPQGRHHGQDGSNAQDASDLCSLSDACDDVDRSCGTSGASLS